MSQAECKPSLTIEAAHDHTGEFIGYRLTVGGRICTVYADQRSMPGFRDGNFVPELGKIIAYLPIDLHREQNAAIAAAECQAILNIILRVENRCMAVDGPVTPTSKEITEGELRSIFESARNGARR